MVIGKFRHEMSRGKDPQLHTHAVIMNMTQRADGKWRALFNDDIFRFSMKLTPCTGPTGLGVARAGLRDPRTDGKGNFELNHISREQIEAFSSRSKVIEEALAKDGKTRADATTLENKLSPWPPGRTRTNATGTW